jgi:peptide/nickel transport system permease protein
MAGFVARRLVYVLVALWIISVIVFGITQVLPGNVAVLILGEHQEPEILRALEERLGLNDPVPLQYWRWFSGVLQGDPGESIVMNRPVGPLIWERFQRSAGVAILSLLCVAVIGIVLGVVAAIRDNRLADHMVSVIAFLGISAPEFFWGIVLIIVFAGYFEVLPTSGYVAFAQDPIGWLQHLILPVATLTLTLMAHITRLTRSSMLDVLRTQYIRAARARGLPERSVLFKHALRNALLPTITVLAINFGWLIGGIVVIESVFAFPGLGGLFVFAIQQRDVPLIQATVLVMAATFALANLVADVSYTYLDPRIRYTAAH